MEAEAIEALSAPGEADNAGLPGMQTHPNSRQHVSGQFPDQFCPLSGRRLFHTDRGAQYTSAAFAQVCDGYRIRRGMGRVGSSCDNALAESFRQGLKRETMHQRFFSTMRQARLEIFQPVAHLLQCPQTPQRPQLPLTQPCSRPNSSTCEQIDTQSQHERLRPHRRGHLRQGCTPSPRAFDSSSSAEELTRLRCTCKGGDVPAQSFHACGCTE
ncbi:DDE-type integrase/transposase/recombinase [Streptomyces flavofungini]|uniref:DDE-type integrase/transposase/recombinase n=1 Tax=Streptomyces flavofungini TaxID=68200 RepID=A0ABS0XK22_9ACTN|nr:DDE-type integrase/transposase/recombinase [Streptomyces flavofungini]